MSEILNNIYIDMFLFVAFVKYISSQICSHVFETVFLDTFLRCVVFEENIFEIIFCCFFYPKTNNFHNSGMVSRRKLPDLSLNNIFSILLIGLQYTLSFKLLDFGLKCRITIMPKVSP